jgi:hypothetical protein
MACRMLLAVLAALILVLIASDALAARSRVALVRPDANLQRSVVVALSPWDIEVVTSNATPPGSALPEAERNAEAIARDLHADAVAWISEGESGAVLWMYDVATNHVASRVLGDRPPFDDTTSAAVALSLKTLLRSSTVAPEPERFGASAPEPPPAVFRIEGEAGARFLPHDVSELRGALGFAVWPSSLAEHLGFGLMASIGPGVRVDTSAFSGHFSDFSLSPSLRTRFGSGRFAIEPALGASMHLTALNGNALLTAEPLSAHRVDASLDAAVAFDVRFGAVMLGARVGVAYILHYQRYLVGDDLVLSVAPLVLDFALRISAGIL